MFWFLQLKTHTRTSSKRKTSQSRTFNLNNLNTLSPSTLSDLTIHTETATVNASGEYIRYTSYFPHSGAYKVHQTGEVLSEYSRGLTVNLYQKKGNPAPHSFEFFTDDEKRYAEGGLWSEKTNEGMRITEYDGVFSIPKEVVAMLKSMGLDTSYIE